MPNNDEGEFELVLGNKQLLSVFFIVVLLLGVFFAMGYIVGRNSTPGKAETALKLTPEKAAPAGDAPSQPSPMPIQQAPATETSAPAAAAPPVDEPAAKPLVKEIAKAAPSPESAEEKATPAADAPAAGSYWQVAATKRAEADMLVDLLKGKGFKARLVPAPGMDGYFRVIVGPAPNTSALSTLKAGLEAAGYKQPIKRDY